MRIGNYNTFEVGSYLENSNVGDMNEFGVKCYIQQGTNIGNGCYINPMVRVPAKSQVASHSVYIDEGVIAQDNELRTENHKQQCKEIAAILSETIP